MKREELELKCPNCYNSIYKKQIVCVECGLQLRKGVGGRMGLFQSLVFLAKWGSVILIIGFLCYLIIAQFI